MKLRHKIIFYAATPLLISFAVIAVVVWHQTIRLGDQQRHSIQEAYQSSKDAELRHYVDLAEHSISHLYARSDTEAAKREALKILAQLDYGDDGYFFAYDFDGNTLVHPRQPELLGRNMWNWENVDGTKTIRLLIDRARNGGGYERYLWSKPSSSTVAPKLAYVIALPKWGWIIGTGIYLDDVDAALAKIDEQVSGHNRDTMRMIAIIALLAVAAVASLGLLFNLSEQRVADVKLRELAQRVVLSQEEERARVSRDLHDGISQHLVSIKLQSEAAIIKLEAPQQVEAARRAFEHTVQQMNRLLGEIRHISHDLRPAILDDLGLGSALQFLCDEWGAHGKMQVDFSCKAQENPASAMINTVMFRVAQEALNNTWRHAQATAVSLELAEEHGWLVLVVRDNGAGFDPGQIAKHPKQGIGLRNMAERLGAVGGSFSVSSGPDGTTVTARVSLSTKEALHA
ncbi:cache domain-containing protein [Herbaspirillum sp. LeCh32-8]|uniref:cache domain-containing protein n=1 Tax=Herbaspirillum sp. LeCh32-8 TaxID=2821356 RepID=UPI001AE92A6F|nr:cache domain-containing protein [Herbaspirillum sp. LeCh32-8]MBP0599821.1 cache domain-containing protein [Herbaspirillum sp. LeCh32-8]